jgi:hypothetical protein
LRGSGRWPLKAIQYTTIVAYSLFVIQCIYKYA